MADKENESSRKKNKKKTPQKSNALENQEQCWTFQNVNEQNDIMIINYLITLTVWEERSSSNF